MTSETRGQAPEVHTEWKTATMASSSQDNGGDVPNGRGDNKDSDAVGRLKAVMDSKVDWRKILDEAAQATDNVYPGPNGMKYRIRQKIGVGAFGVVYDGEMLSNGGWVPVALKFVRALLSVRFPVWARGRAHVRNRNHGRLTSLSYGTNTGTIKSFKVAVRHSATL